MGIIRPDWSADSQGNRTLRADRCIRLEARPGLITILLLFLVIAGYSFFASPAQAQTFGCSPAMANDIVCENSKPGSPSSVWDVDKAGDPTIQGFATDISVAQGQTISFKVNTNATAYRMDIYRMGYYAGNGARLIASITPSVSLPQTQPACITDSTTNLYDCGNWAVSASWTVPANATSGIYFVHLVRSDTGGDSHIVFVVRNDSSHSAILFQTSDETWQAYNDWGGTSGVLGGHTLYGGPGSGNWDFSNRAYKVSYNRPFDTRAFESASWVFNNEYPMIRWLEANGFDVTYFTHVDGVRNTGLITNHKLYMSTGHDEYWSGTLRTSIEAARDAGINLAFFSGNEVFWKTRWENSVDGSNTPYRTLVCYKETFSEAQIDPDDPPTWTGTWRDPTFSPPDDGGRPENNLTGTLFMVNGPGSDNNGLSIKVPAADGKMRFWRNTSEASLAAGTTATLPGGTLGYEWDVDPDNGVRPAGTFDLSTATYSLTSDYLIDNGVTYGSGTATHHMTLHRAASGALVFGAGTVQWSWGLDGNHDNSFGFTTPAPSKDMQQATINLFADMGVQPATVQGGLLLATQSTDTIPPVSTITSPASGANLSVGVAVTVTGTASDSGGGVVGGVEVSVNSGQTWHPASGRQSWSYSFTPQNPGSITIMSRAVDDSGNIETPSPGVSVSAGTTYSISGTISPTAAGNGATVKLTGAMSATVTANSSGVYTFNGLAAGTYTVAPSNTGYLFNPASAAVAVTSGNVTGVNFSGSQSSGATYSISGSATPLPSGAGVTITVTGAAGASTFTDASGNFTISGLANGAYTVTPSKPNLAFAPPQSSVTLSGANKSGLLFTATGTSQTLFTTQTPASVNQSDGSSVNYELGTLFQSNTAGQITAIRFWKDTKETGTHVGSIWSSTGTVLTSVTFTNETASGWQQQALTTPLSIAANTTYVVSVNTGNTFYVATTSGLTSQVVNGNLSSVVGNNGVYGSPGKFPTNSYKASNYFRDIVFASGATYTVSGSITPSANGTGSTVTLTLSGTTVATTTADSSGNYSFTGLSNGNYTVTPTKTGFTFSPASAPANVSNANVAVAAFTANPIPTYTVSGSITPSANGTGSTVTLTLGGTTVATTTADSSGNYSFTGLSNGSYTVTPTKTGFTFSPTSAPANVSNANVAVAAFTANPIQTYTVSGSITPSASGSGSTVTLTSSGTTVATTTADSSGNYSFTGLSNGNYTVTPTKTGFTFSPASAPANVSNANVAVAAFTATANPVTQTLFTTQTPAEVNQSDGSGVNYELGTLFQSNTAGQITAIRFWKDTKETGTHTGHIWSSTGTSLDSVTFTNETASGWQQQALATPLSIAANTSYVVSVNTGSSFYVATTSGLASQVINGNLSSVVGNNGVYGSPGTFPTNSYKSSNYFRDIVFAQGTTYSISGSITPSASGSGSTVTLTLSGTTIATTTADSSGNYAFTGVANSNYTVTPTKPAFTFSPSSAPANVSNANVTVAAFTATAIPTYTVSGMITPSASGSGSTVTLSLSGTTVATAKADSTGTYTFTNVAAGNYTVTPSKLGFAFSPTSAPANVTNANVTVTTFTATSSVNCSSCVYVQSTESGGSGKPSDPTSYTKPTTTGDTLVVFGVHSNWSGSGTTTVSDSAGNIWHPCNGTGTGPFTDIQGSGTFGQSCFYALNIIGAAVDSVTISSTDCASGCTYVAGTYLEYSGPTAWDGWGFNANATSGSGTNNATCGSITTTVSGDLLVCSVDQDNGSIAPGTVPTTFTMREKVVSGVEDGIWSSSGTTNPTQTDSKSSDPYNAIVVAFN
jgi:hypothetical protein